MSETVITRAEARAQGLTHYFTGKPCKHGHITVRFVSTKKCMECNRIHGNQFYAENREKQKKRVRDHYNADPEPKRRQRRKWGRENRDRLRVYEREYQANNRQQRREGSRKWRAANPDKMNARYARRKASKLQRTPGWADFELISVFYSIAKEMTEETGVKHHVDHILPLRGVAVSGLHVASNLQVITAAENWAKGNKFDAAEGIS